MQVKGAVDHQAEIKAIGSVGEALGALKSQESKIRVLKWAWAAFGGQGGADAAAADNVASGNASPSDTKEISGIARLSEQGGVVITVRDLKAKSANDAAIRLAHIVVYAHQKLKKESTVSSRKVLVPLLRDWRVYTGNTRATLASHRGIVREGDKMSLDKPAQHQAEVYVREILDDSVKGKWAPRAKAARRKKAPKTKG